VGLATHGLGFHVTASLLGNDTVMRTDWLVLCDPGADKNSAFLLEHFGGQEVLCHSNLRGLHRRFESLGLEQRTVFVYQSLQMKELDNSTI